MKKTIMSISIFFLTISVMIGQPLNNDLTPRCACLEWKPGYRTDAPPACGSSSPVLLKGSVVSKRQWGTPNTLTITEYRNGEPHTEVFVIQETKKSFLWQESYQVYNLITIPRLDGKGRLICIVYGPGMQTIREVHLFGSDSRPQVTYHSGL